MCGWIKLHRDLLNWGWASSPKHMTVFVHLLLKANHKEQIWMGKVIKKGELATGLFSLSEQIGVSIQSLRTVLKDLKKTKEITIRPTNKFSIISIVNWEKYQETQEDQQTTNKQLTNNQQTTNNKQECKERKERKNERIKKENIKKKNFETEKLLIEFWNSKKDLKQCRGTEKQLNEIEKALNKFLKDFTKEDLSKAIENYASIRQLKNCWYNWDFSIVDFIKRNHQRFVPEEFDYNYFNKKETNKAQQNQDSLVDMYHSFDEDPRNERIM